MPKIEIKNRWTDAVIYAGEAATIAELLVNAVRDHINLSHADLSGAVLRGADLRGADLRGADLRDAVLSGADLSHAVLSGAVLRGADLSGADLRGADLSHADLRDAVLSGAVLSHADLSHADLRDAVLSGAVLKGASLEKNTIIETGETWGQYLNEVLPALLTAGGRTLTEVLTPQHWDCHSWQNCPMAAAFATHNIDGVPLLLKPRAEQFIRYFDAKLIPIKALMEARKAL